MQKYDSVFRDGSVGITTRNGFDRSGYESRWGQEIFTSPYRAMQVLGPTQLSTCTMGAGGRGEWCSLPTP